MYTSAASLATAREAEAPSAAAPNVAAFATAPLLLSTAVRSDAWAVVSTAAWAQTSAAWVRSGQNTCRRLLPDSLGTVSQTKSATFQFFLVAAEICALPAAERTPQHRVRSGRSYGAVWSALTGERSPKNVPLDPVPRQVDHGGHDGALPVDSRVRHSVELGESRVAWASHAIATGSAGIEKNHDLIHR